ncbi:MAG: hypothetical protein ACLU8J_11800 [Acutalibacter sp.]
MPVVMVSSWSFTFTGKFRRADETEGELTALVQETTACGGAGLG